MWHTRRRRRRRGTGPDLAKHPPGSHQHAGAERAYILWPLQARKSASPRSGPVRRELRRVDEYGDAPVVCGRR